MKLLLDENVPHKMRRRLLPHVVFSVRYMHWHGLLNGALLRQAKAEEFDALLTCDANVEHQQNLETLPLSIVVMHAKTNDMEDLEKLIDGLMNVLAALKACTLVHVYPPKDD